MTNNEKILKNTISVLEKRNNKLEKGINLILILSGILFILFILTFAYFYTINNNLKEDNNKLSNNILKKCNPEGSNAPCWYESLDMKDLTLSLEEQAKIIGGWDINKLTENIKEQAELR